MSEEGPSRGRTVDRIVLAIGLVLFIAIPKSIGPDGGDSGERFHTLDTLLGDHAIRPMKYSIIGPLFAAPLWLVGKVAGDTRAACAFYNALLAVLFTLVLGRLLKPLADARTVRRILLAAVFTSMITRHVALFYGEVFTTACTTIGIILLAKNERPRTAAILLVLGAANTPASLVALALVATRFVVRTKRLRFFGIVVATALLMLLQNVVLRGTVLTSGYEADVGQPGILPYMGRPGFSYPFGLGVLSLVFSFGKGILFFAPAIFLPLPRGTDPTLAWIHRTLQIYVVGLVIAYAKWWSWYGGWFWGPRFLLTASIPAAIAIGCWMEEAEQRLRALWFFGFTLVVWLSIWVGLSGLVFETTGLTACERDGYRLEFLCHFTPEFSVLIHPFLDFKSATPEKTRPLVLVVCALWCLAGAWMTHGLLARLGREGKAAIVRLRTFVFEGGLRW